MRKALALALSILCASAPSFSWALAPDAPLTRGALLRGYFTALLPGNLAADEAPELKFTDVSGDAALSDALGKAVAYGLFPNAATALRPGAPATDKDLAALLRAHWNVAYPASGKALTAGQAGQALLSLTRLPGVAVLRALSLRAGGANVVTVAAGPSYEFEKIKNFGVLDAAYRNLKAHHYDAGTFTDEQLVYGAAKGMAEATGDKWAAFFPPAEAQEFQEALSGQYEGIGAYVDMEKAGVLTVTSPIVGSPAEKAGLLPADRITAIDGKEVTASMDVKAAVALIKGPAGTVVKLSVLRGETKLEIPVTRQKVTIKFVEDKALSADAYLIRVTTFGYGVAADFRAALGRMDAANPKRVVIDLRNDPGGSLEEVADMLSQFVPKGEPTVVVKYRAEDEPIASDGPDKDWFAGRTVTVLINGGTASASEIMAGTLKDYYPATLRTVGEKSYGKGSVQTQVLFGEGSSMKFTVAKWFTGKTQTGIDGKGIAPDLPSAPPAAASGATAPVPGTPKADPQLDYARDVRF